MMRKTVSKSDFASQPMLFDYWRGNFISLCVGNANQTGQPGSKSAMNLRNASPKGFSTIAASGLAN
jgi:hypothetical protein